MEPVQVTMTEASIKPLSKRQYMSPAKKRQLIHEVALGDMRYRQIAAKHGVTLQWVRELAVIHKEEIEEIRALAVEKQRELWVMDPFNRAVERMTDIDDLNEEIAHVKRARDEFKDQMGRESEPINDLYLKLMDLKHKLLKQIEESSGQLPTRAQAVPLNAGVATYEIPGIDLGDVVKSWERSAEVPR